MEPTARDYSLVGRDGVLAEENGLASAKWYSCEIDRKTMKSLMRRSDGPALRDTAIWIGALVLSGAGGVTFWGTWWCVPFFVVYGLLYGSSSDSRWHESGHGTAFRTLWMNDVLYYVASFMIFPRTDHLAMEPHATPYRYDHRRTRSGDCRAASAGYRHSVAEPVCAAQQPQDDESAVSARRWPFER